MARLFRVALFVLAACAAGAAAAQPVGDRVPITYVTSEPYIGHMGLGGVGDSKGLMESEFRQRHIKWIANARITEVKANEMHVLELDESGATKKEHVLPFQYSMVIPAFKGVDPVAAVPGLCNPRGFVLIDEHQRDVAGAGPGQVVRQDRAELRDRED